MRTRTLAIALLIPLTLAACGRLNDDNDGGSGGTGTTGATGIEHPAGADELVLRVATGGGFVPVEYNLKAVPGFSLFGDGRLIVQGPVIEIYPGPALPNLQVSQLTEEGVQAILEEGRAAGLLGSSTPVRRRVLDDVTRPACSGGLSRRCQRAYGASSGPTAARMSRRSPTFAGGGRAPDRRKCVRGGRCCGADRPADDLAPSRYDM